MHTSISVKNKNEFIEFYYIYHNEVKKTNAQADLFQFKTLQINRYLTNRLNIKTKKNIKSI